MKAAVLHGPGDLRLDDVPDPDLPPGGLLVAPSAVGICGSDVRTWRHGSPRLRLPQVPGHEIAGRVVATDVETIPVGTRVAVCPGAPCLACRRCRAGQANLCPTRRVLGYDLPGGMAERLAVPADWIRTGGVVILDPALSDAAGACIEPLHTVMNGQDGVRIQPGERVLVLGLGPIGVLHAAVARSAGADVLAIDPDAARVASGAALLGDAIVARPEALSSQPRTDAVADGFDVAIVAVGAREAVARAVDLVAPGGRVLAFGGMPPDDRSLELDLNDLHYRQLSLVGAFGGTPDTFRRAAAWLTANPLDVARFAPQRYPLEAVQEAFAAAAAGRGLKTLLLPGGAPGPG